MRRPARFLQLGVPIRRGFAGLSAAVLLALVAGCATAGTGGTPEETTDVTPTDTPSTVTVTAYYPIDTRAGFVLARETREVAGTDALTAAVETLIAGPLDPDYGAVWNPATQVLGVTSAAGVITVDLSADARTANVGSAGAGLMIQALVYTVTDTAEEPAASVMMTIDGEPAGELWGAVIWDEPVTRDEPSSVRLLVQIDNLVEGATVSSPVVVSGEAAVFEAVLHWQVLDADGAEVASDVTMTAEGQAFAPYSFEVPLAPGVYTVVITEDDPSDGAGGIPMTDSRAITVE